MSSCPLVLVPTRYDSPQARALIAEVQQEYVQRYGGPDAALVDPGQFAPPEGLFLIGYDAGVPVATGGWRRLEADVAEIKRMFVVAGARRRGFAREMLAELERTAALAGIRRLVLNTGAEQPEAIRLYESSGYAVVPGFGHYADAPKARFYGKPVGTPAGLPQDAAHRRRGAHSS